MTSVILRKLCNVSARQPLARNLNMSRCSASMPAYSIRATSQVSAAPMKQGYFCRSSPALATVITPSQARSVSLKATAVSVPPGQEVAPPPARTRNVTGWLLFCNENRTRLKAAHPDKKMTELTKLIAEDWKSLSPSTKAQYNAAAAAMPPLVVKTKARGDPNNSKKKQTRKPTPPNGFMVFSKQWRPRVVAANPSKKATEIVKLLGEEWKKLSDAQKEEYKAIGVRQFQEAMAQQN